MHGKFSDGLGSRKWVATEMHGNEWPKVTNGQRHVSHSWIKIHPVLDAQSDLLELCTTTHNNVTPISTNNGSIGILTRPVENSPSDESNGVSIFFPGHIFDHRLYLPSRSVHILTKPHPVL